MRETGRKRRIVRGWWGVLLFPGALEGDEVRTEGEIPWGLAGF
jgi:hypothetical protein